MSLTDYSFAHNHFQKTQQLARSEGKMILSVDICCIGTSSKTARSAHSKVDPLSHRNVWKRGVAPGKMYPMHIFALYVKRTICLPM